MNGLYREKIILESWVQCVNWRSRLGRPQLIAQRGKKMGCVRTGLASSVVQHNQTLPNHLSCHWRLGPHALRFRGRLCCRNSADLPLVTILDLPYGEHEYIVSVTFQEVTGKINSDFGATDDCTCYACSLPKWNSGSSWVCCCWVEEENGVPGRLQPQEILSTAYSWAPSLDSHHPCGFQKQLPSLENGWNYLNHKSNF